jgi:hypothetical protein
MLPVSPISADEKITGQILMTSILSDLDILNFYLSGYTPVSVSSYGSLFQFKPSKKPKEAGDAKRCVSCAYEPQCVWSAKKIYLDKFGQDKGHVRSPIECIAES